AWLQFEGGGDRWDIPVAPESIDNKRIEAVRQYATQNRLATGLDLLGAGDLSRLRDATYAMASELVWQAAGQVPLPVGTPGSGVESLRLWRLPDSLVNLPDPSIRALDPRFAVETTRFDEASAQRVSTPVPYYGWASTIPFAIKQLPAGEDSLTYEIVGADGNQIVLLERLLDQLGDRDSAIFSLIVGYAPDGSGQAPDGVQTDLLSQLTFGISQVNLSTVTNPGDSFAAAGLDFAEAEDGGPNLLNSGPTEFLRLLWEASITRSGGFYLYYFNAGSEEGLPARIFNDRGEAEITVIVLYAQPTDAFERNRLADYMNAIATGVAIPENAVLTTVADPITVEVDATAATTLAGLAELYYGDVGQLAEDNRGLTLRSGIPILIKDGVYEVPPEGVPPGGKLDQIAQYFGVTPEAIKEANPDLDFSQDLPPFTAVRLPPITVTVGTSPGGNTLESLARYYGAVVPSLGADNRTVAGIFADGQKIAVAGGPVERNATVPAGVEPVAAQRPAVVDDADPAEDPKTFLEADFSLLGYRIAENVDFSESNVGLPAGPTVPPEEGAVTDRVGAPSQLELGDMWDYFQSVPYPDSAKVSLKLVAGLPDPTQSPYRGVGGMLQIDFSWQDLYGNLLITVLSNPQAGDDEPLNLPPLLIGYSDEIIGLGQWPSITSGWVVVSGQSSPKIRLGLVFSPDAYNPETWVDSGEEPWKL
ncbi:MAG: peptidoglycan-binding protein LysM, partial [Thermoanaerobaculia bacterium]